MKKTVAAILILIGIILLSMPFISQKIIEYRMKVHRDLLNSLDANELRKNDSMEVDYDYSSVRDMDINSIFSGVNQSYKDVIVGHIVISDLDISLPILKGTTNEHLMVGATTMKADQVMGEGNYPLAGHYAKNKKILFASLMDIEKDTIVKITDKETIYKYKIYKTSLVPDTSIHLLDHEVAEKHGKPVISLMSCYYTSKNGKRFFAFGELIDKYPYDPRILIQ